jgi:hypothetical protein
MTLYQFKLLNRDEQAQTTWDYGVLLGFREEPPEHMILYRIDDFYVEIHYDSDRNEISRIKSFISDKPLKPYLDKIDLTSLF